MITIAILMTVLLSIGLIVSTIIGVIGAIFDHAFNMLVFAIILIGCFGFAIAGTWILYCHIPS